MFSENFVPGLVGSVVFGLLGLLLLIGGFKAFEGVTRRLDVEHELGKGNVAVGISVGLLFVSIAYVVSHVVK